MKLKIHLLIILVSGLITLNATSQTLDQSQPNYNQDITTRHLGTDYSVYQSFTAGLTGTLVQIDLGFIGGINTTTTNGTGWLRIYNGIDTTGGLLSVTQVAVVYGNGPAMVNFAVAVPVVSGQSYTFRFIPGPGISDPYYLQGENPGTYPGGKVGFINPFNMGQRTFRDLTFNTYVAQDPTGITRQEEPVEQFIIFPNPGKEHITISWENKDGKATVTEVSITDALGKIIKRVNVRSQEKSIEINDLQSGVYFVTLKNAEQTSVTRKLVMR